MRRGVLIIAEVGEERGGAGIDSRVNAQCARLVALANVESAMLVGEAILAFGQPAASVVPEAFPGGAKLAVLVTHLGGDAAVKRDILARDGRGL